MTDILKWITISNTTRRHTCSWSCIWQGLGMVFLQISLPEN